MTTATELAPITNPIPTNALALLQSINAIVPQEESESIEIMLHETAQPIKWTNRQIQFALLDSDSLASMYKQIDDTAKAVAKSIDPDSKQYLPTLKTLANNVRKAKSNITNVETAIKKQLDASIELPTLTKKQIIANVKAVTAAIDETYTEVRAPLTKFENEEKARKAKIESLLKELDSMLHAFDSINGTYTPSAELTARLSKLDNFLPDELANEAALVAKLQDVQKALPDMIKNAEFQEKRDAEAAAAIKEAEEAKIKARLAQEMAAEAMLKGAEVGSAISQQHHEREKQAIAVEVQSQPEPIVAPSKQLFSKEQRTQMLQAWVKAANEGGIPDEEMATIKKFLNLIYQGQVPYLRIVGEA